ncbi:MAG: hypothetical protein US50_C0019G0008 [Candidatus Nomurabacteria bacterium GW2011_GWB1_37_5]|uniref:Uncharacterized protein n=1 Tax=Candidatus Nomurabacteria bacterium GW2011_GWB1_37_5 TaxID=1618742 RepID=A0A0G0K3S9_9BACT|nr:MAG: hypothetical protein US50_C0019G0008 [Candidatus Nomurabacteria bacterium GW2011_GWB1_37_5]
MKKIEQEIEISDKIDIQLKIKIGMDALRFIYGTPNEDGYKKLNWKNDSDEFNKAIDFILEKVKKYIHEGLLPQARIIIEENLNKAIGDKI